MVDYMWKMFNCTQSPILHELGKCEKNPHK